jgi:hypothetical protein
MMNKLLQGIVSASLLALTAVGTAHAIDFDFGNSVTDELQNYGTQSFTTAIATDDNGTDIYAQIVAQSTYYYGNAGSGSSLSDVTINQAAASTTTYLFTLYQNEALTEVYDPGLDYSFDLFFYDIDGHATGMYYDEITVYSASVAEYTTSTALTITTNANGSVTANGYLTDAIENTVAESGFTQAQADVAISFTFENTSTVLFDYTVVNEMNDGSRNLLIDGNDLSFDGFETTTTSVIPEPASILMIGVVSFGALFIRRRFY